MNWNPMKVKIVLLAVVAICEMAFGQPFVERKIVRADGSWEMAQATAPDKWMPAVVPGTVLTTLVKNGVVPDPYFGVNNRWEDRVVPDLNDNRDFYTASFRTRVKLPADYRNRGSMGSDPMDGKLLTTSAVL